MNQPTYSVWSGGRRVARGFRTEEDAKNFWREESVARDRDPRGAGGFHRVREIEGYPCSEHLMVMRDGDEVACIVRETATDQVRAILGAPESSRVDAERLWSAIEKVIEACGGAPGTRSKARARAYDLVIRAIEEAGVLVL